MTDTPRKAKRRKQMIDEREFNRFYLEYYAYVKRVAIAKCSTYDESELVAQETMVKAWRAYDRFDHKHPKAWLNTILLRVVIDRYNRLKRERTVIKDKDFDEIERTVEAKEDTPITVQDYVDLEAYLTDQTHQGFEQWSRSNLNADLKISMDRLSHEHRSILIAREVLDLTYQEIADLFNLRPGTVMSRLFRARTALHQELTSTRVELESISVSDQLTQVSGQDSISP